MSKLGNLWKTLIAGGAGMAALAAVNAAFSLKVKGPDGRGVGSPAKFFSWKHGRIFYKESGLGNSGMPILFVHGIGAGASSFMWRKNFDSLSQNFRVYALDLLGFGFSDKPAAAPYAADLYVELISDFIREVLGGRANVIASSLSSSYLVRVADEHPELVNALILNAPAGYDSHTSRPGMAGGPLF